MKAVLYRASDGGIEQQIEATPTDVEKTAEVMDLAWLEVSDDQRYDSTHRVVDGQLVPIGGDA